MVEFNVKLNNRSIQKLAIYQYKQTEKKLKNLCLVFVIMSLLLIAVAFLENEGAFVDVGTLIVGSASLVFWLIFPGVIRRAYEKQQKKIVKNSNIYGEDAEVVYKFDDKVYIFTSKPNTYRCAEEAEYSFFTSVYEDDDSYLFFISEGQCYVVFKDCLTKGSIEEMSEIIKKNIPAHIKNTKN